VAEEEDDDDAERDFGLKIDFKNTFKSKRHKARFWPEN
jgi:hypothetical protein